MIAAMLGTLRAGCTYVPVDPAAPVERNTEIHDDCAARVTLVEERFADAYREAMRRLGSKVDIQPIAPIGLGRAIEEWAAAGASGTVGRSAQGVQGVSLLIMFPLTFLSNAFVPTSTMPSWLEAFANANPVSHVISAIRDLANNGQVTGEVGWALLGCAVVVGIFAPLSVRSFRRSM